MSLIDLRCQQSVSSLKNHCIPSRQKEYLLLGNGYETYLFFSFPPYSSLKKLRQARLILFKTPPFLEAGKVKNNCDKYQIYPLLDFFNIYNCCFSPPEVDCSLMEVFINNECRSFSEIDITRIVMAWINEEVENKGLLLTGSAGSEMITYASDRYDIPGMTPLLRLTYDGNFICPTLSCVPCKVKVSG